MFARKRRYARESLKLESDAKHHPRKEKKQKPRLRIYVVPSLSDVPYVPSAILSILVLVHTLPPHSNPMKGLEDEREYVPSSISKMGYFSTSTNAAQTSIRPFASSAFDPFLQNIQSFVHIASFNH